MDHKEIDGPVLLRPDNFTPPSRTPWGGQRIRALKARVLGGGPPVGESWELSVEPSFPSRCESGELLCDRIASAPRAWLGTETERGGTALLVKLLDAADELSVQIHPRDDYVGLAPDESGKPESWYVVARDPGSGIYLGLAEGVDAARMERALEDDEDVSALLGFVPVEPGDFFFIDAGTPHCIGRGVMLVEPQLVLPGRRGVTYRYWDWKRCYDEQGRLDPNGQPRALHRADAIAVTDWSQPRGQRLLETVRKRLGVAEKTGVRSELLCEQPLCVARLSGSGAVELGGGRLRALTVLEGCVDVGNVTACAGITAAIPACYEGHALLRDTHAILAAAS